MFLRDTFESAKIFVTAREAATEEVRASEISEDAQAAQEGLRILSHHALPNTVTSLINNRDAVASQPFAILRDLPPS